MSELHRHLQRVRRIIQRDYSASQMNDTRWMALLDALRDLPLWWRYKLVAEDRIYGWTRWLQGGTGSYLPFGWMEGGTSPVRLLEVEWLEVQPTEASDDATMAEIERRLTSLRIPFTRSGGEFRVTGHVRRPEAGEP